MTWLAQLLSNNIIRPIDAGFGEFIAQQHQATVANNSPVDQGLLLLVVLVSVELGKKNACLDLARIDPTNVFNLKAGLVAVELPNISQTLSQLADYSCIGQVSDLAKIPTTPLVVHANRLYLRRYWQYEVSVAFKLKTQALTQHHWDQTIVAHHLQQLFPRGLHQTEGPSSSKDQATIDWQMVACAMALVKPFSVITGGPGTGKTTTVTKLLALLVQLYHHDNRKPIIKLVTPTGKAAARLSESIKGAKQRLMVDLPLSHHIMAMIPDDASTIHRLLGVRPHSSQFIHNRDNLLHIDVLVVDEVSMVDLPMMAKLLEALPDHAQVVLLGDKDQLASVEAGSVLADICAGQAVPIHYSQRMIDQLQGLLGDGGQPQTTVLLSDHCQVSGQASLADCICLLQTSHRFDDNSDIGQLAKAVNQGDLSRIKPIQQRASAAQSTTEPRSVNFYGIDPSAYQQLIQTSARAYQSYLMLLQDNREPKLIIEAFNEFQLLCAVREGEFGVTGLNLAIEKQLQRQGLIDPRQHYYAGRPIMINQNDHVLGLYNGDIGLILPHEDQHNRHLMAWFITPDGTTRAVYPNRLPSHESVYAMTVHKSQGSEFDQVTMVLGSFAQVANNPVITKELVYTGITRAKRQFNLYAENRVLDIAVTKTTQRASGLADLLYPGS